MVTCFGSLSIKFCIDKLGLMKRGGGSSVEIGLPLLFLLCAFTTKTIKKKYGNASLHLY